MKKRLVDAIFAIVFLLALAIAPGRSSITYADSGGGTLGAVSGGIDCSGNGTSGSYGSVTLTRVSENSLEVTVHVTGGVPNKSLSVELWEADPSCGSDDNAKTGYYVNTDSSGDGQTTFTMGLPHPSLGSSTLGDGAGTEQVVISLDKDNSSTGAGDVYAMHAISLPGFVADSDSDGVPDGQDNCPGVAGPASDNGCPLPPADSDGDGVPDNIDQCPSEAGTAANNGCPDVKRRTFDIKYMTFIPANYLDITLVSSRSGLRLPTFLYPALAAAHPGSFCISNGKYEPLVGGGDNRGYDATADSRHAYRSLQEIRVIAETKDGQTTFSVDPNPDYTKADVGVSESYRAYGGPGVGALTNGVIGMIDPADRDTTLNDCRLKQAEGRGTSNNISTPTVVQVGSNTAQIVMNGSTANTLVGNSPSIDWGLTFRLDLSGNKPSVLVRGTHDRFPAYEAYVNNQQVYQYAPDGTNGTLPILRFGDLDVLGLEQRYNVPPNYVTEIN